MKTDTSTSFRDATRVLTSALAPLEKRCLIWMARRMPDWVTSDHLTGLALAAMLAAGFSYWLARVTPIGLGLVTVCLAVNWFGDSLDGTLARVRGQERPRYGFYVDHVVDAVGVCFLLGGMALSGYMSPLVALGVLVVYQTLCVEVFLATHCVGTFRMSYFKMGPTELRLLLAVGNVVLFVHPTAEILGRTYLLFDVGGVVAVIGVAATFIRSAISNTRILYRAEAVPSATGAR
jgi:phosphatidylglycerophosphate synthase